MPTLTIISLVFPGRVWCSAVQGRALETNNNGNNVCQHQILLNQLHTRSCLRTSRKGLRGEGSCVTFQRFVKVLHDACLCVCLWEIMKELRGRCECAFCSQWHAVYFSAAALLLNSSFQIDSLPTPADRIARPLHATVARASLRLSGKKKSSFTPVIGNYLHPNSESAIKGRQLPPQETAACLNVKEAY